MRKLLTMAMVLVLALSQTAFGDEPVSVDPVEPAPAGAPAEESAEAPAGEMGAPAEAAEAAEADGDSMGDARKLDTNYTLALNAIQAEEYDKANRYIDICFAYCDAESDPVMYADLLLKRACIDVINGDQDIALAELEAALKVQPDLVEAWLVRTQILTAQNHFEDAVTSLTRYIELTGQTELYQTVAQLYEAGGNMSAAVKAYDKYLEKANVGGMEARYQSGLYKLQSGQIDAAVADFEACADDETFGAGAQYNIGVSRMKQGDYAAAIIAFNTCTEKGGSFDGLFYNRGVCRMLNGEYDAAIEELKQSVESESFAADARYNLAICYIRQNRTEEADAELTALIEDGAAQEAVYPAAHYYRAACKLALGKLDEALADYTICIDNGYELAQSYYRRAQVYAAMNDSEHQTEDLKNSLKYGE